MGADTIFKIIKNQKEYDQKIFEVEQEAGDLILVQSYPAGIFRGVNLVKERAREKYPKNKKRQEAYIQWWEDRKSAFETQVRNHKFIHIYSKQGIREFIRKGMMGGYGISASEGDRWEQINTLIRNMDLHENFKVFLVDTIIGQNFEIKCENLLIVESGVINADIKGFFSTNTIVIKAYQDYALRLVNSQQHLTESAVKTWLENQLEKPSEHSLVGQMKIFLNQNLKEFFRTAFRIENVTPEDIQLFYFGFNKELGTLHLQAFDRADTMKIWENLPYFQKYKREPYNEDYSACVNDVLGVITTERKAECVKAYNKRKWRYHPDGRLSPYGEIDRALDIHSTCYIPIFDLEGGTCKGVLLISVYNIYLNQGRIALETKLLGKESFKRRDTFAKRLFEVFDSTYHEEMKSYSSFIVKFFDQYIQDYQYVVKHYEFEIIDKHLKIINPLCKLINEEVLDKIRGLEQDPRGRAETFMKQYSPFSFLTERLLEFEGALILFPWYRNHTFHMFQVLMLGNIFLQNRIIRKACEDYLGSKQLDKNFSNIKDSLIRLFKSEERIPEAEDKILSLLNKEITSVNSLVSLFWYIIATSHDLDYPLQKFKVKNIYEDYELLA